MTAAPAPSLRLVAERDPTPAPRLDAVDWLRGAVMIVMALDHTRMFIGTPVDLRTAAPPLFFTRWITHYCAPVFVFLAGTAAALHGRRLGSTRALSTYLVTRGLWLVLLEVTVVRFAWTLQLAPDVMILQVVWAIGMSMVVLAALVWLPTSIIAVLALVAIAGHNLLDGVHADRFGGLRWLWLVLHEEGPLQPFAGSHWMVIYPLIPWVAVMAVGYAVGPWAALDRERRRVRFGVAGGAVTAGFLLLRAANLYGDPHPWIADAGPVRTALSFLDCEKYPPSLLFLAMTLGPALCALAWMDRPLGPWAGRVAVYGRVPLFYYVLHLLVIHMVAIAIAWASLGAAAVAHPFVMKGLGRSLPVVYATWIVVVLLLYPACRWFAGVKRRSTATWLSYL